MYEISEITLDDIVSELLRKSAISITTNIAQSQATKYVLQEFNYLNVALENISRCRSLLEMAMIRFIDYKLFQKADFDAMELVNMSFGLIKKLKPYVENVAITKWYVEDFRQSHLYNCSIDLMQPIHFFIDSIELDVSYNRAVKANWLAINTPLAIASGIGQLNIKVRIKKFNEAKKQLEELRVFTKSFQGISDKNKADLDQVEHCRIQVLKLLNCYFGRLKSLNNIEQIK